MRDINEILKAIDAIKVPAPDTEFNRLVRGLSKQPQLIYLSGWTRCKFDIENAIRNMLNDKTN